MAKIRALKPDFWTDGAVVSVQPLARLLFQGLWNYSCDNGHVEDKPVEIKMRVLPADNVDVSDLLDELARADLIKRADGVITVDTIGEHNRIDKRFFTTCGLAGCTNPHVVHPQSPPREPAENPQSAPSGHDDDVVVDGDGDGDGELKTSVPRKHGTRLAEDWIPSPEVRKQILDEFPGMDLKAEHADFVDYWVSKPGKDGVKLDWNRTWRGWMRRQGRGRSPAGSNNVQAARRPQSPPAELLGKPQELADWYESQIGARA